MVREPLPCADVTRAIERAGCREIPLILHKWWGVGLTDKHGQALADLAATIPDDIVFTGFIMPGDAVSSTSNPSYRWGYLDNYDDAEVHGIAHTRVLLPDYERFDDFLDDFPDPHEPGIMKPAEDAVAIADGRYLVGCAGNMAHERFWMIRGMENLNIDYYENMPEVKRLGAKLLEFHKVIIDRFADLGFHGVLVTDDLGHQKAPFMSPAIFRDLYFPLYRDFAAHAHQRGLHYFVHSCGNNTPLMEMLIEAGVDVFHPVQHNCMDEEETARRFGGRISFMAGFDVQHLLPEGTPAQVREGVRQLVDIFHREEGGLLMAAGNGIMPDTPLENIAAFLEEASLYRPARRSLVGVG